jgi:putative membrane protein
VFAFYDGWGLAWMHSGLGVALMAALGGTVVGLLATFVHGFKRWLIGADQLTRTVHRRAMQAFVEEEVFKTRDRTGILLFVSLFEHRIEVIGDEGINAKVSADDWAEVVGRVRQGILEKKPGEGLVEAITLCGDLLRRRGVEIRDDDTDELPNRLRLGD